jgi:hypothetical protein
MFTRLDKQPKDFLASEADKAAKPAAAPSPTQQPADDEAAPGDEEQDE